MRSSRNCAYKVFKAVLKKLVTKFYSNSNCIGNESEIIKIDELKLEKENIIKDIREGVWIFGMVKWAHNNRVLLFQVNDKIKLIFRLHLSKCVA